MNTKPEIRLRTRLHAQGFRYRLHDSNLPGSPDLVFGGARRSVVFVHGCFWHRHNGCHWCSTPSSNTERWFKKFDSNVKRDRAVSSKLIELGWRVAIVWECACRASVVEDTVDQISEWLESSEAYYETPILRRKTP